MVNISCGKLLEIVHFTLFSGYFCMFIFLTHWQQVLRKIFWTFLILVHNYGKWKKFLEILSSGAYHKASEFETCSTTGNILCGKKLEFLILVHVSATKLKLFFDHGKYALWKNPIILVKVPVFWWILEYQNSIFSSTMAKGFSGNLKVSNL